MTTAEETPFDLIKKLPCFIGAFVAVYCTASSRAVWRAMGLAAPGCDEMQCEGLNEKAEPRHLDSAVPFVHYRTRSYELPTHRFD